MTNKIDSYIDWDDVMWYNQEGDEPVLRVRKGSVKEDGRREVIYIAYAGHTIIWRWSGLFLKTEYFDGEIEIPERDYLDFYVMKRVQAESDRFYRAMEEMGSIPTNDKMQKYFKEYFDADCLVDKLAD